MKWIVVQDYIHGQLMYMVENSETGERRMTTDWQSMAEQFAEDLNRKKDFTGLRGLRAKTSAIDDAMFG